MCTSVAMTDGGFCFGRNMDIEYSFGERVIITPRGFPFEFRRAGELRSHYAIIGMGTMRRGYPLYADGMNEHGLCMAGLSLPESVYPEMSADKREVSPFEFIPWVLGKCANLGDVQALLKETALVNIPFGREVPLTPLHWHIADRSGSLAVECTSEGMRIWQNSVGVLTNSPEFGFHIKNLRQYLGLTSEYPKARFWGSTELLPFGRGFGAIGLPGDFSPASRFVRAAFLLHCSPAEREESRRVSHFFHILDNAAMPRGSVFTQDGREEITLYSCCMSPESGAYFFRSYYNSGISAVRLLREELDSRTPVEYPIGGAERIEWLN